MWLENYDTHFLLFADEGKTLYNTKTKETAIKVRCTPEEMPDWVEK